MRSSSTNPDPELPTCASCGRSYGPGDRFCPSCELPLVSGAGGDQPASDAGHAHARKIHPRLARGELQRVAVARNLAEAELIGGVLLEQGIPSMLRRTVGFDVPDFLAAGPRDVLVPESGVETARELLAEIDQEWAAEDPAEVAFGHNTGLKVAAGALVVLLLFGALAGGLFLIVP